MHLPRHTYIHMPIPHTYIIHLPIHAFAYTYKHTFAYIYIHTCIHTHIRPTMLFIKLKRVKEHITGILKTQNGMCLEKTGYQPDA